MCVQNEDPSSIFSPIQNPIHLSTMVGMDCVRGEGTRGLFIGPGTNWFADNYPDKMNNYGLNLKIFKYVMIK